MPEDIVKKLREKNEEAYRQLVNLTYRKLYVIALKYVKDPETAKDMVQDTYLEVFRKLDQLKDDTKLENWLCIIVTRKSLDHNKSSEIRHNKTTFTDIIDPDSNIDNLLTDGSREFNPKDSFDYNELRKNISELITQLPEKQKTAIILYYYQQIPIKEIAELQQVSENTVKSYLRLGRAKLKALIESSDLTLYAITPSMVISWAMESEAVSLVSIPDIAIPTGSALTGTAMSAIAHYAGNSTIRTAVAAYTAICVGAGSIYIKNNTSILDHLPILDWAIPETTAVIAEGYEQIVPVEIVIEPVKEDAPVEYVVETPSSTTTQIVVENVPQSEIEEIVYVDTAPISIEADYGEIMEPGTIIDE